MNFWTDERYYSLCKSCDDILLAKGTSIARMSISELHILNEHPVNLKKYDEIYNESQRTTLNSIKLFISKCRRIVRSCVTTFFANGASDVLKELMC